MNTNIGKYKLAFILLLGIALCVLLAPAFKYGVRLYRVNRYYKQIDSKLPELPPILHSTIHKNTSFDTKVWLHRVNSIERAALMAPKYKGLEIDVVYDSTHNYFDVGHPPSPSIGLSLETLLSKIPNIQEHYIWLDFKNLSTTNKLQSSALLLELCKKLNIIDNVIVESTKPQLLKGFTEYGFYTSYYIVTFDITECTSEVIEKYYNTIRQELSNSKVNALSTQSISLPFLEKYFPDADFLTWQITPIKGIDYNTTISYLNNKKQIKVLLKNEYSKGFR